MKAHRSVAALAALLLAAALAPEWISATQARPAAPATGAAEPFELVYRNGLVVDGSGSEPFVGTVAVRDGHLVVRAGAAPDWQAEEEFDVAGLVLAPGFIDLHTHARADLLDPERSAMLNYLTQGVSTVVIGNDGDGATRVASRFEGIEATGSGTHVVQYVGHGSLRRAIMPRTDRAATDDEIARMADLLAQGLREGAAGLSSGLFYADGSFATTEEVIELSRVVARFGGIYDSHIRAESSRGVGVLAAVDEAIRIGRESGAPAHIAHIKVLGRDVWGLAPEVIRRVETARADGVTVTADQYPWEASSTQLKSAVVSKEWQAGGMEALRERLMDPELRPTLLADIAANTDRRGGPESLLLLETADPAWSGMRLNEIARKMRLSAPEAAAELLLRGTPRVVSFNMQEEDIVHFMTRDWVATSSDGTNGHPRKYASFPRKYHRFVRELGVLGLAAYVRSSSGLAADILGLKRRGYLRDGYHADLLVFDPETFREQADYQDWNRLSSGVVHLLVAGTPVIAGGQPTGQLPGRGLRLGKDL